VVFVDKTSEGEDDRGAVGAQASAAGAIIEAPKAPRGVRCGEGVPSPSGEGSGEKFFDFGSQNGEFWWILGVLVTVLLLLSFTHKTSVIWPLPIFFAIFRCKKHLVHFLSFWCRRPTFYIFTVQTACSKNGVGLKSCSVMECTIVLD